MRVLANLALFGLLVFCGVKWIFVWSPERARQREDPIYAQTLFAPIVAEFEVLETRAFHRRGAEPFDCTYAIIRLTGDIPADPPTNRSKDVMWWLRFGGEWRPSPVPVPPCDNCRNALAYCARYWPDLGRALYQAATQPGAWVAGDRVGETVDIWAPNMQLAAHIRYGD